MAVNPMLASGINGIQTGMRGMQNAAQDIAEIDLLEREGTSPAKIDDIEDVAAAVVDLKVYQRQVQASAEVVKTADEMMGFLLDNL